MLASSTRTAVRLAARAASWTAEGSVSRSRTGTRTPTLTFTVPVVIPWKPRRQRTVSGTPGGAGLRVGVSARGLPGGVAGQAGGVVTVTVSAAASVFTPSAASRPSRLAAVAQVLECNVDFDGEPDVVVFPFRATVAGSLWVGSIVVNSALLVLTSVAAVVLHRATHPA